MNLMMTFIFGDSFHELYLPNVNNKSLPISISPEISGYSKELMLSLEVWDNEWFLLENDQLTIADKEGRLKSVQLLQDLVLQCTLRNEKEVFSVSVAEAADSNIRFEKYLTDKAPITIGNDKANTIQYNEKFISPKHAVISGNENGYTIKDLNSVNGTFLNGKLVTDAQPLKFGDIIYIIGLKIVFLGNVIAINNPRNNVTVSNIRPIQISDESKEKERTTKIQDDYYLRTPRQIAAINTDAVEIEACPAKSTQKRQPLMFTIGPAFTMVIPMALGAAMSTGGGFGAGGLVMSVGAAVIGTMWALINVNFSKKETLETETNRVNSYQKYISSIIAEITQKQLDNRNVLEYLYPSAIDYSKWVEKGNRRLWEKSITHQDFLSVRLGVGNRPSPNPIHIPKEKFSTDTDNLMGEPSRIKKEMSVLVGVPISVSLFDHRLVGVVSKERSNVLNIARALSAQIAGAHSYTDVKMLFAFSSKESDDWGFSKWLPHTWTPDAKLRMIANDKISLGNILVHISGVLRDRMEKEKGKASESTRELPHYCLFIGDAELIENEPIAKSVFSPTSQMGMTTIMFVDSIDKLPSNCTAIIEDDKYCQSIFSLDNAFDRRDNVSFDKLSINDIDIFAHQLSNIRVREVNTSTSMPEMLTFLDMYKTSDVNDLGVYRKWLENRTYESMKALVGYKSGTAPLYLDIHEKYHGPHGLVAGTTGSGKSETLQTYIMSLAVNYHPHEVSFILIDYKGGGMAGSFEKLPHVAGIITNLGGNQTNRALASINSEIRRRQTVFGEFKVKHIDTYIELYRNGQATEPIPHLLIIADEFAELKKEQPDFVRALVSAARVGRSLGVHLILATQKPSGVVDDEIWGNTRFRLCLRVADKQDSNEMIRRPDAAFITNAGRAFFQVGNDEIFEEFQSGWSGAPYEPEIAFTDDKNSKVEMINIIGKPNVIKVQKKKSNADGKKPAKKISQLDALVAYIANLATEKAVEPIRQIWLAPLPKKLYLSEMPELEGGYFNSGSWKTGEWALCPTIGLADDPVHQSQFPVAINFLSEGHVLVSGSAGSGKTTLLQTLLYSIADSYSPETVNMYIADFNSRTLGIFDTLPHVGGVVFEGDDEKIEKLISMLQKTLASRKQSFSQKGIGSFKEYVRLYQDVQALVFVVDNFISFSDSYPEYEDVFVQLTREAASYGIYIVLTCNNPSDIRMKIRQNITFGIGLQLSDRFEYENAIGERTDIVAEAKTPGRGLIKASTPVEFQTAICINATDSIALNIELRRKFETMAGKNTVSAVKNIVQEVKELSFKDFESRADVNSLSPHLLAAGLALESAQISTLDLSDIFCYTVGGTGKTGKTNMLKSIALQAKKIDGDVFIFDGVDKELESFASESGVKGYITGVDALFDFMKDVLVPTFQERNPLVAEARDNGKDLEAALAGQKRLFFLINDMSAFCEAAYNEEKDMSGFLELALVKGKGHKIYFFACITPNDYDEYMVQTVMRNFVSWHEGIQLGGLFDQQSILEFDLSPADRARKLSAGIGYVSKAGQTQKILVPWLK